MLKIPILLKEYFALLHKKDPERYHYLLWLKFVLLNVLFVAVLALFFSQGWIDLVFAKEAKTSWLETLVTFSNFQALYISTMTGLFLFGIILATQKIFMTSQEINYVKLSHPPEFSRAAEYLDLIRGADSGTRQNLHQMLEDKWYSRISIIKVLGIYVLPLLGFLGTVSGFVIVMRGVSANAIGDTGALVALVANLLSGMSLALFTTLVGGVLGGLWLVLGFHILKVGSSDFLNLLGERGEKTEKSRRVKTKTARRFRHA